MTRFVLRTHLAIVLLIGVLAGGATLIVAAGIPADDGYIYGCYSDATGALRLVSTTEECRSQETGIAWNQVGPAGPEGPVGPAGATGPTGVADAYSTERLAGEYLIPLQTQSQTIARFDLLAGRYAIAASTTLRNDSSYGTNAVCGVLIGNRSFDAEDTVWGGGSESQAITGVGTLSGPGSVTLLCRADASGAITLVSFSLTAIPVGTGGTTTNTGSTSSTAGGTTTASGSSTTGAATSTTTTSTTTGTTGTGSSTGATTGTTTAGITGTTTGTTGTSSTTAATTTGTTGETSTGTSGTTTGTSGTTTGTSGTTTGG